MAGSGGWAGGWAETSPLQSLPAPAGGGGASLRHPGLPVRPATAPPTGVHGQNTAGPQPAAG